MEKNNKRIKNMAPDELKKWEAHLERLKNDPEYREMYNTVKQNRGWIY